MQNVDELIRNNPEVENIFGKETDNDVGKMTYRKENSCFKTFLITQTFEKTKRKH